MSLLSILVNCINKKYFFKDCNDHISENHLQMDHLGQQIHEEHYYMSHLNDYLQLD